MTETMYQYALQEKDNVIAFTKVVKFKSESSHPDFTKRVKFYDKLSYLSNRSAFFKTTLRVVQVEKITKVYYNKDTLADNEVMTEWKQPITKMDRLPSTLANYKESVLAKIKRENKTFILGSNAFIINELDNPHLILRKHRQALYFHLGVDFVIEEVLEYNPTTKTHEIIPTLVKKDDAKLAELNYNPERLFKLIFYNLEKSSSILFTEFNNHSCSAFTEILLLQSMVSDKPDYFLENFIKFADKVKPVEKVLINKVCYACEKRFSMKESELEIYIIKGLDYPSTCQACIDEQLREKKIREELEKNLEKIREEENNEAEKKKIEEEEKKKKEDAVKAKREAFGRRF